MIDLIQGVLACLQGRVLEGRMCGGDGSGGDVGRTKGAAYDCAFQI